jgi:hypothetical protein
MPKSWSAKRERQYEHIKDSLEERGTGVAVCFRSSTSRREP